jgi:2-polyprenyl-3-methyl-5-hydroxy-6-metoxy-1,4-benzoquinol methylase
MTDRYTTTIESWNKLADAYNEKFMDLDLYNGTYDVFCDLVEQTDAHIFEIGCGPGNITRYLLGKRPGFAIDAIDVSPAMAVLAKQNNPQANVSVMDCREIGNVTQNYNGVVCGFCLPYLEKTDCERMINDCARLLLPDGVLYLSAIEGDYAASGWGTDSKGNNKMFVHYYDATYLTDVLKQNGFSVTTTERIPYKNAKGEESTHLVILARKKR